MKRILMFFLIFCVGCSMSYAQSYDLNKDGKVNSSDVVALYNYIESGSASELTKDDIVGTWKIMYGEYSRWENDVLVEEEKGNVEEVNNYYVVYADNKVSFMEYSDDIGMWGEDGILVYSLYNGNFYPLGGDFKSFKLLEVGGDQMQIEAVFEEDKGTTLVRQRMLEKLVRVSKETNILPLSPEK